jgi:hypothetical protein
MREDLDEGMPEEPVEWHLARDGQQYGPLSDAEMAKFWKLGHLQMTDLVWRTGLRTGCPLVMCLISRKRCDGEGGCGFFFTKLSLASSQSL